MKKLKKEKYITETITNNGKYHYFKVQIPTIDGDRKTFSVNANEYPSARDAQLAAVLIRDKALQELHSGILRSHMPTVGKLFMEAKKSFGASEKTIVKWDRIYNALIVPYQYAEIDRITATDINKTLVQYAQDHTEEQVKRVKTVWHKIFVQAQMDDCPVPDKTLAVQIPKCPVLPKSRDKVTISEADFFSFIAYLDHAYEYTRDVTGQNRNRKIRYACLIMWYTGMRPQEAFALSRSSINLVERTIHISRSVGSTATAKRQFKVTKTKQSIRDVPICDDLLPICVELLNSCTEEDLFLDSDGLPFEIDNVCTFICNASKASGVHYTMYMCRHTVATDLFNSGTPQQVTRDILGHASASMSLGYARSTDQQKAEALEKRKMS